VNAERLGSLIKDLGAGFTMHQQKRGGKLLDDLTVGADAYQKKPLPPCVVPNICSAEQHGDMLTDKLASWVDSGIACGPFKDLPLPGFRANALMAVEKGGLCTL
jgi:hypothetical protein